MLNRRDVWVDNTKVLACILVVIGHFWQSIVKAGIFPNADLYQWSNYSIYLFHVSLFFVCSGYLYQKYSHVTSASSWWMHIRKKALALGVPYVVFSTATWLLKKVFSSSVNNEIGGLFETLVLSPTSPYWYLYTLFFIFMVVPTFQSLESIRRFGILAICLKLLSVFGIQTQIYAVDTICSYMIWFVLGMYIPLCQLEKRMNKKVGWIAGAFAFAVFVAATIWVYKTKNGSAIVSFALGLLACSAVIVLMIATFYEKEQNAIFGFLARYTMPIYLMHTIFAAPCRIVLQGIGIQNAMIHIIVGLTASFVGPIVAACIMKRFRILNFFLQPNKYVKIK